MALRWKAFAPNQVLKAVEVQEVTKLRKNSIF